MKSLVSIFAVLALTSACTSVSTTKVGDKDIIHVTEIGLQFLNNGGAPVGKCVTTLGEKGATRVITAAGAPTDGLFGLTRSIQISGVDMCSAAGEK